MNPTTLPPCLFTTLGMFIIDTIEFPPDSKHPPQTNLIGGAGTYAALGSRLALSPTTLPRSTISWIVDTGTDFPPHLHSLISTWRTNCIFRHDPSRLTTRAWNGYGPGDFRAFKYTTPKRRLEVADLDERQVGARSFHMVCSAGRCGQIVDELSAARAKLSQTRLSDGSRGEGEESSPVIVWEPIPDLCTPEELLKVRHAAERCSVISPNHDELLMFFSKEESERASQDELVVKLMGWNEPPSPQHSSSDTPPNFTLRPHSRDANNYTAKSDSQPAQANNASHISTPSISTAVESPICIIREGAHGSTAYFRLHTTTLTSSGTRLFKIHVPAFHSPQTSSRVIDPTGGGNTYLGALAVSLTRTFHSTLPQDLHHSFNSSNHFNQTVNGQAVHDYHADSRTRTDPQIRNQPSVQDDPEQQQFPPQIRRILQAMTIASVSASFAIEQFGVPALEDPTSPDSEESWNGQTFSDRLREYLAREPRQDDFSWKCMLPVRGY